MIFSKILSGTFFILRRFERDMIKKSVLVFMYSTLYAYQIFNDTCTFLIHFRIKHKYQISRKSVQWEQNFSMPTDGQTGANSRLSQRRPELSKHKFHRTYSLFKRYVSYRAVSYRHKSERRILEYDKNISLFFLTATGRTRGYLIYRV